MLKYIFNIMNYISYLEQGKTESTKIENVAGSVIVPFINGTVKCKLKSTPPALDLANFNILTRKLYNF
jgi:hypothetical protein